MKLKNILLLTFIILLASLSTTHAQAGLYVIEHNITYRLSYNNYDVEEKLVFKNTGETAFTVQRWVSLERGNVINVEIEGIKTRNIKLPDKENPTLIRWYLEANKGVEKEVTIKYTRNDRLTEIDNIITYTGDALGRYSWETTRSTIKFITPKGYQFGNITPIIEKKIVDNQEEISYNLILPYNKVFLSYGLPVEIEYGKFKELAFTKIDVARSKIVDAKNNIEKADFTIENSKGYGANISESLDLYNQSIQVLKATEEEMDLAEKAYNTVTNTFYEAYLYAINTESLADEASEMATKAEQKTNFEVQKALNEKIDTLTSIMTLAPTTTPPPTTTLPPTDTPAPTTFPPLTTRPPITPASTTLPPPIMTEPPQKTPTGNKLKTIFILFLLLIVAAGGLFLSKKKKPHGRRGELDDFQVISDLKKKKFQGFEDEVDRVKKGVEIASELRKLRKEKDELKSSIKRLEEKRLSKEIDEDTFVKKKKKVDSNIKKIDSKIKRLEKKLDKIKKAK